MRKIAITLAVLVVAAITASAGDRPVTFSQLPAVAQAFINANFPGEKVSFVTVDDDFVRPDYTVVLANGSKVQFRHSGALEKVEVRAGVPAGIVPVQILDFVKLHYPDAFVVEYEVGKRSYEVKLSNRMDLKFNRNWNLVEIDD